MGSKLSRVEVAVIIISIVCCSSFLFVRFGPHVHSGCGPGVTNCGANLSQLVKAMYNYSISKTKKEGVFPDDVGTLFWERLAPNPPFKHGSNEVEDARVFQCSVKREYAPGVIDYRGPASNSNELASSAPLGCDRPGNHGEAEDEDIAMNWVAKSGDTHKVPASSVKWRQVLASTRD